MNDEKAVRTDETRWICLGTSGGPFQQSRAFQISNALTIGDDVYLFDVGNGVLRQLADAGIAFARIRAVFVTHHHPDHIADLGLVMLTHWLTPGESRVDIRGPVGTSHLVEGLTKSYAYTALTSEDPRRRDIAGRFSVADAPQRSASLTEVYRDDNVVVETLDVEHFRSRGGWSGELPHAIGYRITTPDRVIAYTGDTGASPLIGTLADGADLLVSEVVSVDEIVSDLSTRFAAAPEVVERVAFNMRHNHISPGEIGSLARRANVGQVLLTHFVPLPAGDAEEELIRGVQATAPGLQVHVARDLGSY